MVLSKNPPGLKGLRALVVDDEPDTCLILKLLLDMYEVEVLEASSADTALRKLSLHHPDVLICDIAMPVQDGYWLIEQVRALPVEAGGTIPAIALTGYSDEVTQKRVLAAGFQAFTTKPFDINKILDTVVDLTLSRHHCPGVA